jgi:hypothetical protein
VEGVLQIAGLGVNVLALIGFAVAWGAMREKVRRNERDVNGLGRKLRQEINDHLRDYHGVRDVTPVRGVPIVPPPEGKP